MHGERGSASFEPRFGSTHLHVGLESVDQTTTQETVFIKEHSCFPILLPFLTPRQFRRPGLISSTKLPRLVMTNGESQIRFPRLHLFPFSAPLVEAEFLTQEIGSEGKNGKELFLFSSGDEERLPRAERGRQAFPVPMIVRRLSRFLFRSGS